MHFYPGVAEYQNDVHSEPYRVFLNEDTIRSMDPTFAGRPVFVMHVDGVDDDVNELRKEADGWVVESFYNQADGKHWVKFIVVSDKGERAIRNGMRLSNCYVPKGPFGQGGLWNGVTYDKEIKGGEYEHLALVPNPRYEESVVLTPEEFKRYNEDKLGELKRLANDKEPKVKFFKRSKVENSADLEGTSVLLKSGRDVTIAELVKEAEAADEAKKAPRIANGSDKVKIGDETKTVADLLSEREELLETIENAKKCNKEDDEEKKENDDEDDDMKNDDDDMDMDDKKKKDKKENDDDEDMDDKAEKKKNKKKKNEADDAKKAKDKEKADRVRNAPDRWETEEATRIDMPEDQVARGKTRYGS